MHFDNQLWSDILDIKSGFTLISESVNQGKIKKMINIDWDIY